MNKRRVELWEDVPGFEGFYQVSNLGRVYSVPRVVRAPRGRLRMVKGHLLKGGTSKGYRIVTLSRGTEATQKTLLVHLLVLLAFRGPRPPDAWGLHSDGDPMNNSIWNLRYGTPLENSADRVKHGRSKHTAKTKAKMSVAHSGKKFTDKHRLKISISVKKARSKK